MCEQAVKDAKQNSKLNGNKHFLFKAILTFEHHVLYSGINNVEFHCGKAEDLLPSLVKKYPMDSNYEIIAIVDPPRPGLHQKVLNMDP